MDSGAISLGLMVILGLLMIAAAISDVRSRTISNELNAAMALLAIPFWIASGLALWPDIPVLSEECFEDGHCPVPGDRFFSVDPLDGTKGFIQGKVSFAVCIGLVEHGRPTVGAISAPAIGKVWWTDGDGVFRRGFDDTTAERVTPRERPADGGLALVSNSLSPEAATALAAEYGCPAWEAMDSAVKFCLLADGTADVYPRNGPTCEWDTVAGEALIRAAGGRMADIEGNPMTYGRVDRRLRNPGFVAWAR